MSEAEDDRKEMPSASLEEQDIRSQENDPNTINAHTLESEQQKLRHNYEIQHREENLYSYTLQIIKNLFIAGYIVVACVMVIILCKGSAWVLVLGSVSLLIPTTILIYLTHYVYCMKDDEKKNDAANAIINENFIVKLAAEICKAVKIKQ